VGIDRKSASAGHRFYPTGWLRYIEPNFTWDSVDELGNLPVSRSTYPGIVLRGKWNSLFALEYHIQEQTRAGSQLFRHNFLAYSAQVQPSRLVSSVKVYGNTGNQVDFLHERVGEGGTLGLNATLRPGLHWNWVIDAAKEWLDIRNERLFTADAAQLKVTYNFSPRMFLRAIGQIEWIQRNPALYASQVQRKDSAIHGSLLFGYRLNWQTVFYAGYSDERELLNAQRYERTGSHFFLKVAYAWEK
jgi:hypothetical protein